jgi:hypothetical protein
MLKDSHILAMTQKHVQIAMLCRALMIHGKKVGISTLQLAMIAIFHTTLLLQNGTQKQRMVGITA